MSQCARRHVLEWGSGGASERGVLGRGYGPHTVGSANAALPKDDDGGEDGTVRISIGGIAAGRNGRNPASSDARTTPKGGFVPDRYPAAIRAAYAERHPRITSSILR